MVQFQDHSLPSWGAFPEGKGYDLQAFYLTTTDLPVKRNQMDNLWTKEQIEALDQAGCKFTPGGSHISRTIMLAELKQVLDAVPSGSPSDTYRSAILTLNVLGKGTESTRQKSLRHLRELYALDEATPIFGLLRKLHTTDAASLPLLAVQVAWARDPLLRATTPPIMDVSEGERVETASLAQALEAAFPNQYSELNRNKIARNAASSWTQSGHLAGRATVMRLPTPARFAQMRNPTCVVWATLLRETAIALDPTRRPNAIHGCHDGL